MSQEKTAIEGAICEIKAGMVLVPANDCDLAWNGACQRAVAILDKYAAGHGLFQETAHLRAEENTTTK